MKDLELTLTIRNNQLKQRRLELGLSQPALAKAVGMSMGLVNGYETLHKSPVGASGDWKDSAVKLAGFFGMQPEDLFPEAVLSIDAAKRKHTLRVDAEEAMLLTGNTPKALPSPEQYLDLKDRGQAIHDALHELTTREGYVVAMRCGFDGGEGHTLEEVAEAVGITKERARRVEAKAYRKLRHPTLSKRLKPFWLDPDTAEW
jgi:transcriptional regulator with XRE-family HTH domain